MLNSDIYAPNINNYIRVLRRLNQDFASPPEDNGQTFDIVSHSVTLGQSISIRFDSNSGMFVGSGNPGIQSPKDMSRYIKELDAHSRSKISMRLLAKSGKLSV